MLQTDELVVCYKLQKISDVDDESAGNMRNIEPVSLTTNLKPFYVIW
jgi:hypothetical protein